MKSTCLPLFLSVGFLCGCPQEKNESTIPSALSDRESSIVKIAACTAIGDLSTLKEEFNTALNNGMTLNEIKEIPIQMYAYCGFPRSLQGINTLMNAAEERKASGITDTEGPQPSVVPDSGKYAVGKAVLERLTGKPEQTPPSGANAFAPGIDTFLKEHLFADIFGRGLLSDRERELATCAALSVIDYIEPMREAHYAMARNCGVSEETLSAAVATARECRSLFEKTEDSRTPFASGTPGPREWFTGTVYVRGLVNPDEMENLYSVGQVTFEPKARTFWHTHPIGQVLLVLSGNGFYKEKDRPARKLSAGDVVCIPKNIEHWHGAAPDSRFVHIAISNIAGNSAADWLNEVSDSEYESVCAEK